MQKLFYLFFVAIFLHSCAETKWERRTFIYGISLEVPDYMTDAEALSASAIVQLENQNRELYFIIEKGSKQEFETSGVEFEIGKFSDRLMESMRAELKNGFAEKGEEFTCDKMPARHFTVTGKTDMVPSISYQVGVIDGGEFYYILSAWTTTGARTSWYKEDMITMMKSFKLLR